MANQLNGTTFYVDSAHGSTTSDDFVKKQCLVSWIIVTATAANARIVLGDVGDNAPVKLDLRVPTNGVSQLFHFRGLNVLFPNGVKVLTLTNAIATIGLTNSGS